MAEEEASWMASHDMGRRRIEGGTALLICHALSVLCIIGSTSFVKRLMQLAIVCLSLSVLAFLAFLSRNATKALLLVDGW